MVLVLVLVLSISVVYAGNSTTVEAEDEVFFVTWRYSKGVEYGDQMLSEFNLEEPLAILADQMFFIPSGTFTVGKNDKKVKSQYLHLTIVGYSDNTEGQEFYSKEELMAMEDQPAFKGVISVKFSPMVDGEMFWYIFHAELKVYEWQFIVTVEDDPETLEDETEGYWDYVQIASQEYADGETPNGFGSLPLLFD
jgi:hypothetical protein